MFDSCEVSGSFTERGTEASAAWCKMKSMPSLAERIPAASCRSDLLEVDPVANAGEVLEASGGEVVDAAHLVSLLEERVGQG